MNKDLFCCALSLLLAALAGPASAQEGTLKNLLDARSVQTAASVFDGSGFFPALQEAPPVQAGPRTAPTPPTGALAPAKGTAQATTAEQPAVAPIPAVAPVPARGLTGGFLGLYPESDFVVGTGRCAACNAPKEGKWYFLDDIIAAPVAGPPALVWLGSPAMVDGATLSEDGATVRLQDGTVLPFELTPKIASNRSFYDATSLAYLKGRPLRIRGEFVQKDGVRTLVARTLWPEEFRIDAATLKTADAKDASDIDGLVGADKGGARKPFMTRLLWEKDGAGRDWAGKPVMGFMVNGAQGDDDEALAGHFSLFTGRMGTDGSMADWMFDNFYDMNSVSEKGIIAGMVPMDKYMGDVNSGQSWYRPSDVLVMVMKDSRIPLQFQEKFKDRYAQYYAQVFKYDHTHLNCTALIADPVRKEGWRYPETGKTPTLIAKAIAKLVSAGSGNPKAGEEVYQSLREEPTRSFPRESFNKVGGDILSLAGAPGADDPGRELSPLEKMIQEDLLAVVFVRIPQIPSSRAFGRDPAGGVMDYFHRTPLDHKKWKTIPTLPRSFPPPGAPGS